jgi:hypothetical protein
MVNIMTKQIFSRDIKVWLHYIPLTLILFLAFFSASWSGIVTQTTQLTTNLWVLLFVWYYLFISIGDQIIHYIFNKMGLKI